MKSSITTCSLSLKFCWMKDVRRGGRLRCFADQAWLFPMAYPICITATDMSQNVFQDVFIETMNKICIDDLQQ